jgi:hypothetical protein
MLVLNWQGFFCLFLKLSTRLTIAVQYRLNIPMGGHMKKNNPREINPQSDLGRRQMHFDRSRNRHFNVATPDYGLRSDRIHRPSSGFSYSDAEISEDEHFMNPNVRYVPEEPNRDVWRTWSEDPEMQRRFSEYDFDYSRHSPREVDEALNDFIYNVLSRHPDIDVSQFGIQTRDGQITLRGAVETRRMKRLIEDVIYGLPGVRDVQNRLEVTPHDPDRHRMAHSLA